MRRCLAVLALLAGSASANPSGPGGPPDPVAASRHRVETLPFGDRAVAPIAFSLYVRGSNGCGLVAPPCVQAAVAQRDRWTFRVLEGTAGQVAFVAEYDMGWQGIAVVSSPTLMPCVTDPCDELIGVTPVLALDGDSVYLDVAFDYRVAFAAYRAHVLLACREAPRGWACRASKYALAR